MAAGPTAGNDMKNSKDYSQKVHKLYRSLKKKYPQVEKATYEEPVDALVYAILSEQIDDKQAQAASRQFSHHFVDVNDLRVSRIDEIVEVIGQDTAATRDTALRITKALGHVFNAYNKVSLESLKKVGKRPARTALEKIEGVSRFAVDYCMLTSLGGHALPLTGRMVEYLHSHELVRPQADEQEIEGFLAKRISAKNGYEFYWLLRRESESTAHTGRTKAGAKTKPKPEKKTDSATAKTK